MEDCHEKKKIGVEVMIKTLKKIEKKRRIDAELKQEEKKKTTMKEVVIGQD